MKRGGGREGGRAQSVWDWAQGSNESRALSVNGTGAVSEYRCFQNRPCDISYATT